jgi:acetyl esterase/lipase
MKAKRVLILILLLLPVFCSAQKTSFLQDLSFRNYTDETYGSDERNKFDIMIPESDKPVPLVIFIHGGGFRHGDKDDLYKRKEDVRYFLQNNIAVATIIYRFYKNDDSLGVKVCLSDVQRALQYIRHKASKYNIDKSKIACYGISAGAGSSLFLAFHDDMAIPGDTTLAGESTRISCAGAISTQSTYDVFRWKKIIPWFRAIFFLKHSMLVNAAAHFYGYRDYKSFRPHQEEITRSLDMMAMIDSHDPPVYLINPLKERFPSNDNVIQHHRSHVLAVAAALKKAGVENYCFVYKRKKLEKESDAEYPVRKFLAEHLK